ncbi:MAG: histidine phosphatase family protein [Rhodocyclales bacterium]|nr:histidine phosphatase family protein [Rhodocyclales bacterium]
MKRFWMLLLAACLPQVANADEALWAKLKAGGNVVLMRHASTEGGLGDPPGFKLGNCATQRNLSEAGREEARRLGRQFKFRAVNLSTARSSQWCRCQETARLAFGEEPEPWPLLNSLNANPDREIDLITEVEALAAKVKPPYNAVLVTHNFNIQALTGISPATAEIIIVRGAGGKLEVVGRIPPSQ